MPKLGIMPPQARAIILEVCTLRGVDPLKIVGRCRVKKVFRARVEIALALDARGYSSPRIGRILNHDHTTIVFYLGRGKKKPGPLIWRRPKVRHLRWVRPDKAAKPKVYLKPYAGADWTDYQWKEMEIRP